MKICYFIAIVIIVALSVVSKTICAQDLGNSDVNGEIIRMVEGIKEEKNEEIKSEKAKQMLVYVSRNTTQVKNETVVKITELFGEADSRTREWAVMALAHLGERANVAIPALKKILRQTECNNKSKSSVPAIQEALERMGVKVNYNPRCRYK